ncbi:MAG: HAD-IA family hydrolase [Sphingobium sp.]
MIEAVVWDFGGVLTSSPFEAFNRYEQANGLPRDLIRRINATNPDDNAWALIERSEIGADEFDRLFAREAAALGHDLPGRVVLSLLSGEVRPRMVAALDACRARGLKTGCITNNAMVGTGAGMADSAAKADAVAAVMAKFDHVIESSKVGLRKPDPRIYTMMCERLDVPPSACVYLDDLGINCKPAAKLGFTAIKVVSEEQALADLSHVLAMEFA